MTQEILNQSHPSEQARLGGETIIVDLRRHRGLLGQATERAKAFGSEAKRHITEASDFVGDLARDVRDSSITIPVAISLTVAACQYLPGGIVPGGEVGPASPSPIVLGGGPIAHVESPTPAPTPEKTIVIPSKSPTPEPSFTVQPSAMPTETSVSSPPASVTITESPKPTVTAKPSPTENPNIPAWVSLIPENPYKNPDEVPLAPDFAGHVSPSTIRTVGDELPPHYGVGAVITIYDLMPDVKNNRLWIGGATDVPNAKIKITPGKTVHLADGSSYPTYEVTGAPLWVAVSDKTLDHGSDTSLLKLVQELKIGSKITVYIVLGTPDSRNSSSDINMNKDSWDRLLHSGGKSFSRKDMVLKFFVGNLRH